MSAKNTERMLFETGVVAIMRAKSSDQLLAAAEAIMKGGVNVIEVTMTTPNALKVIQEATDRFSDDVLFGAGTVLDPETARAAILAGAQFIVTPTLNKKTIKICRRYAVPIIPGAYTPTEILTAWEAGASSVKVFPASAGGPGYIKAIKAPLPQISLTAVGGVNVENTAEFFSVGVDVVGVGGELVNQILLDRGDLKEITRRAEQFQAEAKKGKIQSGRR